MSEFECRNGHLIAPSVGYCRICGGRAVRMDGMTARQIMQMEQEEQRCYDGYEDDEDTYYAQVLADDYGSGGDED